MNRRKAVRRSLHCYSLIIILVMLIGCDSTDYINDADGFIDETVGAQFITLDYNVLTDSTYTVKPPWGTGLRLFVGNNDDYSAASLIKFNSFPSLPDSIEKVTIEFSITNSIGRDIEPVSAKLFVAPLQWDAADLQDLTISDVLQDVGAAIDTQLIQWRDADTTLKTVIFDIPLDIFETWVDSSSLNGVIIASDTTDNPGFIASMASGNYLSTTVARPVLTVHYLTADTLTKKLYSPSEDGYVLGKVQDLPLTETETIYTGGGFGLQSIITIDDSALDTIPRYATITRAVITFNLDTTNSRLPINYSSVVGIDIRFSLGSVDSIGFDSFIHVNATDSVNARLPFDGDIISLNITSIFQKIISEESSNNRLVFSSRDNESQIYKAAFFGTGYLSDPALRPKIEMYYIIPGESE